MNPSATTSASVLVDPHDADELAHSKSIRSVYVYEAPIRIWHCLLYTSRCV